MFVSGLDLGVDDGAVAADRDGDSPLGCALDDDPAHHDLSLAEADHGGAVGADRVKRRDGRLVLSGLAELGQLGPLGLGQHVAVDLGEDLPILLEPLVVRLEVHVLDGPLVVELRDALLLEVRRLQRLRPVLDPLHEQVPLPRQPLLGRQHGQHAGLLFLAQPRAIGVGVGHLLLELGRTVFRVLRAAKLHLKRAVLAGVGLLAVELLLVVRLDEIGDLLLLLLRQGRRLLQRRPPAEGVGLGRRLGSLPPGDHLPAADDQAAPAGSRRDHDARNPQ